MGKIKIIGELDLKREQDRRIYEPSGLAPTLRAENHDVKILVGIIQNIDDVKECKVIGGLGEKKSNNGTQYFQQDRVYFGDIQPAQPAQLPRGSYNFLLEEAKKYRIRKLTPRECWRLMAFSDEDFDKAEKVVSNTQLYKQAGNSICVCVLMAIFSQMNIKGIKPWNERN